MEYKRILNKKPDETELNNSIPKSFQSADTFFHFVKEIDYLIEIITDKRLYPRYCEEDFSFLQINIDKVMIAMKCFCDIPLHKVNEHRGSYGDYCIGFTKDWGIKKGLQPVIYCNPNSAYKYSIKKTFEAAIDMYEKNNDILFILDSLNESLKYIKISHGFYPRVNRNYDYTDEKEWRYVPSISEELDFSEVISNQFCLDNTKIIENYNSMIKKEEQYALKFDFDDVKYLFVNTNDERDRLIEIILKTDHPDLIKYRLISKINVWEESEGDY